MKHAYALLLAATIGTTASAQLLPFPDSAAVWVNTFYSVYPFPPPAQLVLESVHNICVYGEDTLINGLPYTQVHYCGGPYKGAWRDDAGQIYYVPEDSTAEFLLYDFTLEPGDEADVYFEANGQGMMANVTVGNTSTSTDYGGTRKVLAVEDATWIEGIGATWGLFTEPWANVSNYLLRLECMSQLDSIHYPGSNVGAGVCAEWAVEVGETSAANGFSVVPNPTTGLVQVWMPGSASPVRWQLRDAQGRLVVIPSSMPVGDVQLDLTGLAEGLYFLNVECAGKTTTERIVRISLQ